MVKSLRWTPPELVKVTAAFLAEKGVPSPRLDAELLLCRILGYRSRVEIYTNFERRLAEDEVAAYRALVKRRAVREPVSRILGEREFMGIGFRVTPDVFSPRPETEILVEEALRLLGGHSPARRFAAATAVASARAKAGSAVAPDAATAVAEPPPLCRVLDLGTGSGAIAVSVAVFCPHAQVVATDISPAALAVAAGNAESAGVAGRVEFRQGDLFAACRAGEKWDLILSNPPYLAIGDPMIEVEARDYDPPLALYAGHDGLDAHRRIAAEAKTWLNPGGWLLLETAAGQASAVRNLLAAVATDICVLADYAGKDRVVCGRRSLAEGEAGGRAAVSQER